MRCRVQQVGDARGGIDHLLKVVQQEQELLRRRASTSDAAIDRPGDSRTSSAWAIAGRMSSGSFMDANGTKWTPGKLSKRPGGRTCNAEPRRSACCWCR